MSRYVWDTFADVLGCLRCSGVFERISESSVLEGWSLGGAVMPFFTTLKCKICLT